MAKVAVGWGIEPNPGSGTVELLSATVLPLLPVYDFCVSRLRLERARLRLRLPPRGQVGCPQAP